jgi:hypothetical protein
MMIVLCTIIRAVEAVRLIWTPTRLVETPKGGNLGRQCVARVAKEISLVVPVPIFLSMHRGRFRKEVLLTVTSSALEVDRLEYERLFVGVGLLDAKSAVAFVLVARRVVHFYSGMNII